MEVRVQGRTMNLPVPILVAGVLVLIVLFMSMRIGRVSASDIGILINNTTGKVTVKMEPGSFFYNDLISDLHTINKTLRTMRMNKSDGDHVRIKTRDGSDVEMDVEVNYRLLLDEKTIREAVLAESGVKSTMNLRQRFGAEEAEGGRSLRAQVGP
jgi:regulator of protease activity HflC (stomatin/prohibitin superfamily)